MHPNFYHWHARAELKPELSILEPRWKAATKFAEKLSADDIRSLLQLVLFPGAEPDFAKRFAGVLVKAEPTFPVDNNAELLRVMASAAAYSQMENASNVADALALGLYAADFPDGRIKPVSQDVMVRAEEYLIAESERVRPKVFVETLARAEKQAETLFTALKKATETNTPQEIGKATEALGRGVLGAMKDSHKQLGDVIGRVAEESQFLWWLIGRRSPALNARRDQLAVEAYALPAAMEATERVALLPPAASIETLLDEVLAQCSKGKADSILLADFIDATNADWVQLTPSVIASPVLTPLAAILATKRMGGKVDATMLKQLHISSKTKATPAEAAQQYFHEQMFLRALRELG